MELRATLGRTSGRCCHSPSLPLFLPLSLPHSVLLVFPHSVPLPSPSQLHTHTYTLWKFKNKKKNSPNRQKKKKKPNKTEESCEKGGRRESLGGEGRRPLRLRVSTPTPAFLLPLGGQGVWGKGERGPSTPASPLPSPPFPGAPSCRQLHLGGKKLNWGRGKRNNYLSD